MSCRDGCCELNAKARRPVRRSARQERYGRLWAEVELPEQLLRDPTNNPVHDKKDANSRFYL
jgi:hypothetical protein